MWYYKNKWSNDQQINRDENNMPLVIQQIHHKGKGWFEGRENKSVFSYFVGK